MEAVFRPEIARIFSGGFLSTSCAFRQEPVGNHLKKCENFPAGILLPQNHRNYPEPAVSGSGCSTWVLLIFHFDVKYSFKFLPNISTAICHNSNFVYSAKNFSFNCSDWILSKILGTFDTFYLKSGVLKYNLTVPVNLLALLDCT